MAVASQPSDSASAVVGSMDSVRSSSGMHGCLEWLVDSGATSHILAERNLQFFEVVKEYEGVVDLKAANGEKILVSRVVELAVYMACFPGNDEHWTVSKRKFQRVVLTHVIVASIDFNVLSPYVLAKHGWELNLSSGQKSCLRFRNLKFALEIYDRGWWFICEETDTSRERKPPVSPVGKKKRNPNDIDVDQISQSSPVKGILKQGSAKSLALESAEKPVVPVRTSGKSVSPVTTVMTTRLESTGLTYLLRVAQDSEHDRTGSEVLHGDVGCVSCHSCQQQNNQTNQIQTNDFFQGCTFFEHDLEYSLPCGAFGDAFESCLELGFSRDALDFFGVSTDVHGKSFEDGLKRGEFFDCVPCFDISDGCADELERTVSRDQVDEWLRENETPADEPVDHPLPPLDYEFSEDGDAAEPPEDLELGDMPLYAHLSQGHEPYVASCHACARSKGRMPARRVRHERSPFEVAMDITFLGPLRILVMVVLTTSMYGAFQMYGDLEKDARVFNNWLRELGMTGKRVEVTLDGERRLETLVRTSMRLDNCTVAGVTFKPTPPNRSQTNGKMREISWVVEKGFCSQHAVHGESDRT